MAGHRYVVLLDDTQVAFLTASAIHDETVPMTLRRLVTDGMSRTRRDQARVKKAAKGAELDTMKQRHEAKRLKQTARGDFR